MSGNTKTARGAATVRDNFGMNENTVFEPQEPLGHDEVDDRKFYHLSEHSASMLRPDGVRLVFVHNVYATNVLQDQQYLDNEIAARHPKLRMASPEEIMMYRASTDLRGLIKEQVAGEVTDELRDKIRQEVAANLEAELEQLVNTGTMDSTGTLTTEDGRKIAGTSVQAQLDKLRGIRHGNATTQLLPTGQNFAGSIQNSGSIADRSAGSTG